MNFISTVKNSSIVNGIRSVVATIFGANDSRQAAVSNPFGVDSSPVPGMAAVYIQTSSKSQPVFIGYANMKGFVNPEHKAQPGEIRTFATDMNGNQISNIWQHGNGKIELSNNNETLVACLSDLMDKIEAITVPTGTGPSGVPLNAADFAAIKVRINNLLQ